MQNNLVSIITPTYNAAKYIAETIQSVQNQDYINWEMILVDDASTDETIKIISGFANGDYRIKVITLNKNSGSGVARNTALNHSKGRYIAFLDDDDLWKPEKLSRQIEFLTINNLPFTFSFYECIGENGENLNKRIEAPKKLTYLKLFYCNFIGNLTGIYDVDYYGKIPITTIRKRQDWIMWLAILKKIRTVKPVPESLAYYRVRKNSLSSSKLKLIKYNFKVYTDYHKLNFFLSSICIFIFLLTQLFIKPFYTKKT